MKKIEFKTTIAAKRDKVWNTMLQPTTYREWVSAGWPGSTYEGNWKQGEDLRFIGSEGGGTMANVVELRQPEYINIKHVAIINKDGSLDRVGKEAKGWIGSTEEYIFTENNGKTELKVVINTSPEWAAMFNEGWPAALNKLKEICERTTVTA